MKYPYMKRILAIFTGTVLTFGATFIPVSINPESVHADVEKTYTIDDLRNLQDFLLAKDTPDLSGKDYDLNDDDQWDVFDLCLMRQYFTEKSLPESDTLIAYFSCTGNTETIASYLEKETGGDMFEIVPTVPYTAEDLNYNTDCRANREQNDPDSRPEISELPESIESYDVIYIGYPIWWGEEPRIIDTFLESFDFSEKIIIPFCTSGSSGITSSVRNIREKCADSDVLEGRRFSSSASQSQIADFVSEKNTEITELKKSTSLVAYFSYPLDNDVDSLSSASVTVVDNKRYGSTEYVASVISENTESDLFQIEIEDSYGTTYDEVTKSVPEEKEAGKYPSLKTHIDNPEQYDTIYIGFPTWWYSMPQVMYAFFEEYDFSGKTIYLFNTSGGSGLADAISEVKKLEPNANVSDDGLSVYWTSVGTSKNNIISWLENLVA